MAKSNPLVDSLRLKCGIRNTAVQSVYIHSNKQTRLSVCLCVWGGKPSLPTQKQRCMCVCGKDTVWDCSCSTCAIVRYFTPFEKTQGLSTPVCLSVCVCVLCWLFLVCSLWLATGAPLYFSILINPASIWVK